MRWFKNTTWIAAASLLAVAGCSKTGADKPRQEEPVQTKPAAVSASGSVAQPPMQVGRALKELNEIQLSKRLRDNGWIVDHSAEQDTGSVRKITVNAHRDDLRAEVTLSEYRLPEERERAATAAKADTEHQSIVEGSYILQVQVRNGEQPAQEEQSRLFGTIVGS